MDYTIFILIAIIVFAYLWLYVGGRFYLRENFVVGNQPMLRNNVPPMPSGF